MHSIWNGLQQTINWVDSANTCDNKPESCLTKVGGEMRAYVPDYSLSI